MKLPPTPCPRCGSPQPFKPLNRDIGDNRIEVYIRCTMCRFERVLRVSTSDLERFRRLDARLKARSHLELKRHGVVSNLTFKQRRDVQDKIRQLQEELQHG